MHPKDNAASGAYAVASWRRAMGEDPEDGSSDEQIADVIANLLHYAVSLEMDPEEVLNKGWSYFDGDDEELQTCISAPNSIGYHGSPAALFPGEVLKPGPHLAHVFASETADEARMWGRKQSKTGGAFVYKVQLSEDCELGSSGFYASSATVIECIDISKEQTA